MPRNGDGLYRRKGNPVWKFKYKDQSTGEWIEESTGTRNHNEARRIRQDWMERSQKGQLPTDFADYQLADALDQHQTYVEATAAPSSLAPYRTSSRHLKRIVGERKPLKAITSEDVRRYQIARRRDGAAPKTINNEVLTLTALLRRARVWSTIEPDYKPLKVPKNGPGVALTPEEGQRLFAVANSDPAWFVAVRAGLLAYSTGCRLNEIRRLQLGDVALDRTPPRIRVRRAVTKSDAGVREVVLNELGIWAASALLERGEATRSLRAYALPASRQLLEAHQSLRPVERATWV
jgi:integrase